jgi:hypothetical protein
MSKKTETIVALAPVKVAALLGEIGTLSGHVMMSRFGQTPMNNIGIAIVTAQSEISTNGLTPVFISSLKRIAVQMPKSSVKVQQLFDKLTLELNRAVDAGAAEVVVERDARLVTAQEVHIQHVVSKARANRLAK